MCEICTKLTIKTPEQVQRRRSGVFIDNFEHISHLFLVFLLLTLNEEVLAGRNKGVYQGVYNGNVGQKKVT